MAHNIEEKDGQHSIAYLGSRNDVWHKLGQEMEEGQSLEVWAKKAGLDWEAETYPAYFFRPPVDNDDKSTDAMHEVPNAYHVVRKDTNYPLGYVTERYKIVQPREVLEWFEQYISVDDRFKLDVAGCLKNGEMIWATAKYNGDIEVAGNQHRARLLMTTSFDGTYATTNKMTMTRVVCNNTLDIAMMGDKRSTVKTTHSAKFDAKKVGEELANLAASIQTYKKFGDAMVKVHMADQQVQDFFKEVIGIKDAEEELSTRTKNNFNALCNAYNETLKEGTEANTQWAALNAVTRYVDHDRSTRMTNGISETEAKFFSAQFTSGSRMKKKAVELLTADKRLQELLAA